MKKLYLSFFTVAFSLLSAQLKAQNSISQLIRSGPGDASKLAQAYSEPLFKGFGATLNSGWYSTAKGKDPLEFELKLVGSAVFTPDDYKTFDVTKIGLSNNVRPATSQTLTPTLVGNNLPGAVMNVYDNNGNRVDQFTMPRRQLAVTPLPLLQASLGILGHTEITLRGFPEINMGKTAGSIYMIGGGFKHDIMQDFMGKRFETQIPFHLAVAFGYTHLYYSVPVTVSPQAGATPTNSYQSSNFYNQHIGSRFNGYNAQVIISKKFSVFVPFAAVGYNSSTSKAALIGNYPVTTGINNIIEQQPTYTTFSTPVNISETSINGPRVDAGFQVELGAFRFYASGSTFKYSNGSDLPKRGTTWAQSVATGFGIDF